MNLITHRGTVTIEDLCLFVLDHSKHNKAFLDMDKEQIFSKLYVHFLNQMGQYSVDPDTGLVDGVVLFVPNYRARILYIRHFLCTTAHGVKTLLRAFNQFFGGFTLCGKRRGKIVTYRNPLFVKKLSHFSKTINSN